MQGFVVRSAVWVAPVQTARLWLSNEAPQKIPSDRVLGEICHKSTISSIMHSHPLVQREGGDPRARDFVPQEDAVLFRMRTICQEVGRDAT